ncbi:hypothetical protein Hanom_Chr07g00672341 [Helianthus anomalus]
MAQNALGWVIIHPNDYAWSNNRLLKLIKHKSITHPSLTPTTNEMTVSINQEVNLT